MDLFEDVPGWMRILPCDDKAPCLTHNARLCLRTAFFRDTRAI